MTFTGRIGASDSRLGNIVLGYASRRRSPFRRYARSPQYRVQVLDFADTTTYGIGSLIVEFENAKNIGWSDYLNDVPQAFFTVNQDDPKVSLVRGLGGKAHIRIWRNDDLVWTGWFGMERDANATDVIFYCYGYLAGLYHYHTSWKQTWTSQTVQTIVSDAWTRAKTTLTHSRLGFVTTGLIESPPTIFGGSTAITLPTYVAFYKRILFLMQEMAAVSASDTGNSTAFAISHALSPVFSFHSDRSTALDLRLEWGSSVVSDFSEYTLPVYHRNDILAVGSAPRDVLLRTENSDSADITAWGRMEESLFFPWVRDQTELDRATALRATKAKLDQYITLVLTPGALVPPGAVNADFALGDTANVKINRGVVNVDARQQITGVSVVVANGQEYLRPRIQEPL